MTVEKVVLEMGNRRVSVKNSLKEEMRRPNGARHLACIVLELKEERNCYDVY